MNFLDAHKIVHDYIDIFARGRADPACGVYIGNTKLNMPDWQNKLIQANQLFVSHAVLWNSRTPEDVELLFGLLIMNPLTDDYESYTKRKEAWAAMEKASKSKVYQLFNRRKTRQIVDAWGQSGMVERCTIVYDKTISVYNAMCRYRNEVFDFAYENAKAHKWDVPFPELIYQYCTETYKQIGIEYKQGYDIFFYKFDQMRNWLQDERVKAHFKGYEHYIYTHN